MPQIDVPYHTRNSQLKLSYMSCNPCEVIINKLDENFKYAGGMIHLRDGANTQYVTGTAFLFFIYSNILRKHHESVSCGNQKISPDRLRQFAKQQVISYISK